MPTDNRALARAVRARAARTGETYTAARAMELAIRERIDFLDETPEEAEANLTDPANEVYCQTCGWTVAMVCPECSGCGCQEWCAGYRHHDDPNLGNDDEPTERTCRECGLGAVEGEDCVCE